MAEAVKAFASYLQFKEIIADPLGHLYRAGEYDSGGVKRAVWLRVFDRPMIPAVDLISGFERAQHIADAAQSANLATGVDCVVADGLPAIASDYISSQPLNLVFDRVAEERFPIQIDNALLMVEALKKAEAPHKFHHYPDLGHMGIIQEVIDRSLEWIEEHSKK